jgi:hypothetical protein
MSVTTVGVDRDTVYRKIGWRLLPFVLACFVINYLDRVSIGYAKLQFLSELRLNEAVFGLITSVFFFGYIAFEVPSNLLLMRIGAPATLARIMVLWGAVVAPMTVRPHVRFAEDRNRSTLRSPTRPGWRCARPRQARCAPLRGGLRPCLTAAARNALRKTGRGGETARSAEPRNIAWALR